MLDVGTGTGILSYFAIQAGAKKVYAVEASQSAAVARQLAQQNGYDHLIEIIPQRLEDISLPERVDVIISEPIGFLLVHERMLESYVLARERFLKEEGGQGEGGKGVMMPSVGDIVFSPLSDEMIYKEQINKGNLWQVRHRERE